jgi:hypothetical protein
MSMRLLKYIVKAYKLHSIKKGTVIEVEKLIRCTDCKHYDTGNCRYVYGLIFTKPDSYCSWAERKER